MRARYDIEESGSLRESELDGKQRNKPTVNRALIPATSMPSLNPKRIAAARVTP
jgi:hypothetical protein